MHKTLIFDLGKVLVPFDFQLGYRALAGCCPHDIPEVRLRIAKSRLVEPFEKGLIESREFVRQLSAALDLRMDYGDFCRAWSCIFHGQLIGDAVLESLSARYRLLLLSNTNPIHWEMILANYPMVRYFHDRVLSYEVHAAKPEAAIFHIALERAGCRPEECFFTDDINVNVEAAQREGIDAVRFESPAQLEEEMARRGIRWEA